MFDSKNNVCGKQKKIDTSAAKKKPFIQRFDPLLKNTLLGFSLVLASTYAAAANWVPIPRTEAQVDTGRIGKDRDGYVHIWTKVIYPPEIIKDVAQNAREYGQHKDYSNYSHSVDELVVNCKTYQYFQSHSFDYSAQGNSISSTEFPFTKWNVAAPGSTIENIINFGCNRSGKR